MAKLLYVNYYKANGIRRYQELLAPRLRLVQNLELPKNAIYHFTSNDPSLIGPPENEYMLSKETAQLWVSFAPELAKLQGAPRRNQTFQLARAQLDYRSKHRRFRLLREMKQVEKNINAQIVSNFAHLNKMYIYRPTLTRWYDQWLNLETTVWSRVNELAKESARQQFILMRLPEVLPKISEMRMSQNAPTRANLMRFQTHEELNFFDLFRYFGFKRDESCMSLLDKKALDKVNLVLTDGTFFFVLNLGLMEGWRDGLAKEGEPLDKTVLENFQRRWMMAVTRLWMQNKDEEETTAQEEQDRLAQDDNDVDTLLNDTYDERDTPVHSEPLEMGDDDDKVEFDQDVVEIEYDDDDDWLPEADIVRRVEGVVEEPVRTDEEDQALTDDLFDLNPERASLDKDIPDPFDASVLPSTHDEYVEDLNAAVIEKANQLADAGQLSGVQYKAAMRNADAIHDIEAPDGSGQSLAEYIDVPKEATVVEREVILPDSNVIVDKSMRESSIANWDPTYVTQVMDKDIAAAVVAVQQAGYPVTGYQVEKVTDIMGDYQVITIKLAPVGGVPSTFTVMLPTVEPDGIYTVNGVKYRMRKQRVDLPIRKVSPEEVALSTAYGKVFVRRSERVVNNVGRWLTRQLSALYYDKGSKLTALKRGNVFDMSKRTPYYFSTLSKNYTQILFGEWDMRFDLEALPEWIGTSDFDWYQAQQQLPFAKNGLGEILSIGQDDQLYVSKPNATLHPAGSVPEFFGLDLGKMPVESVDLEYMGVRIPVGVVLSYMDGLTALLKHLKTEHRVVPRGARQNLAPEEFAIAFDDESLILNKDDRLSTLLIGGFTEYRNYIGYARGMFDQPDIYLPVVEGAGLKIRHLKELDRMRRLFIDPVSRKLLTNMGEPTDFRLLLIRAAQLLMDNWSPTVNDQRFQRFKTYDKFSELLYKEMVGAIRLNENSSQGSRQAISISPVSVWNAILDDSAAMLVDETNPLLDIKQTEEATLSGTGGRSKKTMRDARSRAYDPSDVGVVSEGTKDSGDVGISAYLSPNANIVSVYGETRPYDPKTDGISSIMSTSTLAVPGVDKDNAPRLMFVGIQQNQMIATIGNDVQPWRTGGETVIAQRVGRNFARTARGDGVIKTITKRSVTIVYDDPELGDDIFEIGTKIGKGPGKYYPHDLITDYVVGQRVKERDVVVFHALYFKRDWWNPGQVLWRSGVMSLVGILDIPETHEDSSYAFDSLTDRMVSPSVKSRTIIVDAHLNIRGLVKVGDEIQPRTIVATLEEPLATDLSDESQEAVEALRKMSQYNPRADVHGEVVQIDVLYRAQIEDMSETMAKVVVDADKARAKRVKELRLNEATTGRINNANVRIDGEPLGDNQVAIRIFMRYDQGAGMGDKGTFAAQAKSVISTVGHGVNRTEDGHQLDALFSGTSFANRIIGSPEVSGTVNLGLMYATEKAVSIYFNEDK